MQAYGDILLGWHHFPDGSRPDYYLRQLRDWKGSFDVAAFDPQALAIQVLCMDLGPCARTLG